MYLNKELHNIERLSITLMDRTDGPFSLEIDYIGVECDVDDVRMEELTAYEEYSLPYKNWSYSG